MCAVASGRPSIVALVADVIEVSAGAADDYCDVIRGT